MRNRTLALSLVAAWLSVACGATQTRQTARLSDAQIAHITTLVDSGEVEQAWLATDRATNELVKSFAGRMIAQHTAAKRADEALTHGEQVAPARSRTAEELAADGRRTLDRLKLANARSFDAAYMDAQIRQHEEVAELLADKLIPEAIDPELRERLKATQAMVVTHLQDAREIRAGLARSEALEPRPVWVPAR
jgi:putative membrane protein